MSNIRPMLAAQKLDLTKMRYPCFIQPKIDGIRARIDDCKPLSRTNKVIPNQFIREWFEVYGDILHGLDGELVTRDVDGIRPFNDIQSEVMSEGGKPDFRFIAFDVWNDPTSGYQGRLDSVKMVIHNWYHKYKNCIGAAIPRIEIIGPTYWCTDEDALLEYKDEITQEGHEGAIIRFPSSPYKYGRSSMRHGALIKFKDFLDDEATVIGFEELLHNDNPQQQDAFGLTKRSSHKANQRPGGVLGKLVVEHPKFGQFKIGSGFDWHNRELIWSKQHLYKGLRVTFKYQPHGMKDKPRSPIFKGFRHD